MIKLVIASLFVAAAIAADIPYGRYASRPTYGALPTPTYRPIQSRTYSSLPSPTYSPLASSTYRPLASPTYSPLPSPTYSPLPAPTYNPLPSATYNRVPVGAYNPQPGRVYAILRSESDIAPDGSHYQYAYETENGISAQEVGDLVGNGPDAGISAKGSYQYTSPEGILVQISYVADENGFQPSGNVLPTPPPIPEAILRSIAYNEAHPEPQSAIAPVYRNPVYQQY